MDVYSKKEACELWGIPIPTLESRLNRDNKVGNGMQGTRKSAGVWLVTKEYMVKRYGEPKGGHK